MYPENGAGDVRVYDCQDDTPIKTHLVHLSAAAPLWIQVTRVNPAARTRLPPLLLMLAVGLCSSQGICTYMYSISEVAGGFFSFLDFKVAWK